MRGLETSVIKLRRKVFVEVAKVAFESENVNSDIEAIPYKITPTETPQYRESIYRERAIAAERVRLAMGMSLNPQDQPAHITKGLTQSNVSDLYYEPPLMQVIPSACDRCTENAYVVSDQCRACVSRYCVTVCPTGAVKAGKDGGRAEIDRDKCIKCGKCKAACPYEAIAHRVRPCSQACGVKAIVNDELGRAHIDVKKCVGCGQCMVSCPFGAIADKSQIFQLIQAIKKGDEVVAEVAPSIVGQFGKGVTLWKVKAALKEIGFKEVYEVAHGADVGAATEAHHYATEVATGKLPFLLTSCCPAWSMLAKTQFPETIDKISSALTPMVATARTIKQKRPHARVVFIGPCAAKKLEAMRKTVRSDVDFVITFEELAAMFEARNIDFGTYEKEEPIHDATGAGRGYAVAGGVASAIEACVRQYYPDVEVKIEHAEGLSECRKMLLLAKLGKKNGCLIEGMGCPGGCVAGAGVNVPVEKGAAEVKKFVEDSTKKMPEKDLYEIQLP